MSGPTARSDEQPPSAVATATDGDPRPVASIERGAEVGRYTVLRRLGAGGMGAVYSAYDAELDRRVALKLVTADADSVSVTKGAASLMREGRALAKLRHPNLVGVYDVGWHGPDLFVAMEQIDGVSMRRWQREQRPVADVLSHYLQAGRGLQAAHEAGIVHGDFKPDNVMVEEGGRVVVLDFGLATRLTETTDETRGMGTPAYMAPEQHLAESLTPASDQFAFCVALYEGLTGRRPFPQTTAASLAQAVLDEAWTAPGREMPAWVWRQVQRGLAVDPRARHDDMAALLRALDPQIRRRNFLVGGIVGLGALVTTGAVLTGGRGDPCEGPDPLSRAWDDSRKASLDARYDDAAAWTRVRGRIDHFSEQWHDAWTDACRATHVDRVQSQTLLDRRVACLDDDRVRMTALLDALDRGNTSVLSHAIEMELLQRPPHACGSSNLERAAPLPTDPEERARYDTLMNVAARAQTMGELRELKDALSLLEAHPLRTEDHPAAIRAVEAARGGTLYYLDRYADAHAAYDAALRAADAAGDETAFVWLAGDYAVVLATGSNQIELARAWFQQSENRAQRVELTVTQRMTLLQRDATISRREGRYADSITAINEALELASEDGDPIILGRLYNNLGLAHLNRQALTEATDAFKRALALRHEGLGPEHINVGQTLYHLGRTHIESGQLDAAEHDLQRAVDLFVNLEGAKRERAEALEGLAIVAAERGDFDTAIRRMRAVMDSAEGWASPTRFAGYAENLAQMLFLAQRFDEAALLLQNNLRTLERVHGSSSPKLWGTLHVHATVELERGNLREALQLEERAAAVAVDETEIAQAQLAGIFADAAIRCTSTEVPQNARTLAAKPELPEAFRNELAEMFPTWAENIAKHCPALAPSGG
ncbi:MAG: serine/threonine-protein kinase [Myxococcota bacterium]